MKVAMIGSGYVGLVTAACLAHSGHQVSCLDIDSKKISQLKQGICPIFEPGLEDYIVEGLKNRVLSFTNDPKEAFTDVQVIFIAVGTPSTELGSADTGPVLRAAESIGTCLNKDTTVVLKSTVPVGTGELVHQKIQQVLNERGVKHRAAVVSNPEFLKEGTAVNDFMKPDRIIVGTQCPGAEKIMRELYAPFNRNHDRMLVMDTRSAELSKYAANAMLATKISFINEMAHIAELVDADIEQVRQGIGADPRIGHHFIYPGCGYGGSCFPKDILALEATALESNYRPQLLRAVREVNERQKQVLPAKINHYFNGDLSGRTFAVWGLAFKPQTDDMREAPSRVLLESLWQAGAKVRAYDPQAMNECQAIYGERDDLMLLGTKEATVKDADALIICTEWKGFWAPDFDQLAANLKTPVIFDGRNLYEPELLSEKGFDYIAIGRSNIRHRRARQGTKAGNKLIDIASQGLPRLSLSASNKPGGDTYEDDTPQKIQVVEATPRRGNLANSKDSKGTSPRAT